MTAIAAWWEGLIVLQRIFFLMALPATIILFLQTLMQIFGLSFGGDGDFDSGSDLDLDGDFDVEADFGDLDLDLDLDVDLDGNVPIATAPADISFGHSDIVHDLRSVSAHHDHGLRLFTMRGVIAFLSVTGWSGIVLLNTNLPTVISVVLSIVFGEIALLLIACLMYFMMNMESSGNLDMRNAVGLTGQVYITIRPNDTGKIMLTVQDKYIEASAITEDETPIKCGETVKITGLVGGNTLVVERIPEAYDNSGVL